MDRDSELAKNYGEISRGINREVEGEWYLIEAHATCWIDTYLSSLKDEILEEYVARGYKITPVSIFRKAKRINEL